MEFDYNKSLKRIKLILSLNDWRTCDKELLKARINLSKTKYRKYCKESHVNPNLIGVIERLFAEGYKVSDNSLPESLPKKLKFAVSWLQGYLGEEAKLSSECLQAASEVGIPRRTLARAKSLLNVHSVQYYRRWYWYF